MATVIGAIPGILAEATNLDQHGIMALPVDDDPRIYCLIDTIESQRTGSYEGGHVTIGGIWHDIHARVAERQLRWTLMAVYTRYAAHVCFSV